MTRINIPDVSTLGNAELQGDIFYVDGNRPNDGGSGKSWADAFQSLATGLAASHADIGRSADRQWAGRNTVYVKGDALTEDLVALAQKTDVVGVGSYNAGKQPGLIGNHVISGTYQGCRFFNFQFEELDSGIMWTLVTGQTGMEFHNCTFSSRSVVTTTGVLATAVYSFKVIDCQFESAGAAGGFSTACISLGTGVTDNNIIRGNNMRCGIGVLINSGATNTAGNIIIDDNVIHATTLVVDDNADSGNGIAIITNNTFISGADNSTLTNCIDFNVALAANNVLTGSTDTQGVPFITIS